MLVGALAISLIGIVEWNAFLKRLSGQELGQVLTTMGFALIFQDLALVIWGGDPYTIPVPAVLSGQRHGGAVHFPGLPHLHRRRGRRSSRWSLWLVLERTRIGAMMRATVDDPEMARGVGINVFLISMGVFCLGREPGRGGRGGGGRLRRRLPGRGLRDPARTPSWSSSWAAWAASRARVIGSLHGRPPRQLRQGALPGAVLLHAVRADGR